MKTIVTVLSAVALLASTAAAQQPGHQNMPMPMPQAAQQPASGMCGAEDPTKPGMSSMGCGGCSLMRGMMTGTAPTGMMAAAPNESAKTIQLRGEMMKAMGEIMLKYGKMMEGTK